MKRNQKGFGVIEGLLAIIAITLIGGVGFYVVNANKDNKKSENISTNDVAIPNDNQGIAEQIPQKTEEELIVEAVKKAGIENADGSTTPVATAKVTSVIGNNAKGSAGFGTEGGGYAYVAHKTNGNWNVIYRGQQLPGTEIGEKYKLPSDWYDPSY